MNRGREAAERFAERRKREDESPRLKDVVPNLESCKLLIEDARAEAVSAEVSHTRRVVVDNAPALFIIPCGDASCKDGGHDLTNVLMKGMREGQTVIRGEDTCYGYTGSASCGRNLKFTAECGYKKA